MEPIENAVWYIESHYEKGITLDDVAEVAGVSRFHLSRAFSYATGLPLTRYLRQRRLSKAAESLAMGKSDILDLALSVGYSSHEAFSRAFREFLGVTPDDVRRRGNTKGLNLLGAIKTGQVSTTELAKPEIRSCDGLLLAGRSKNYIPAESPEIPGQWQKFLPTIQYIPDRLGSDIFGVSFNSDHDSNYAYLCGISVSSFSRLSKEQSRLSIPAQTYAVFSHPQHVSQVLGTYVAIWSGALRYFGLQPVDAPFFERYSSAFRPDTGDGGLEIWIPVREE